MNNTTFVFYHPHLDVISDRTLRAFVKKASSVLRDVQRLEVAYLIDSFPAAPAELQSIRDRLREPLKHIDAFYLQKVEKGSFLLVTTIAAGLWLLQTTIGESVKEAWTQVELHKKIVSYLTGKTRNDVVDKCLSTALGNITFDKYLIDSIEKEILKDGSCKFTINLVTQPSYQDNIDKNCHVVTVDDLVKVSKDRILALEDNSKKAKEGEKSKKKKKKKKQGKQKKQKKD